MATRLTSPITVAFDTVYSIFDWSHRKCVLKVTLNGATSVTLEGRFTETDTDPVLQVFTADDEGELMLMPFIKFTRVLPSGAEPVVELVHGRV